MKRTADIDLIFSYVKYVSSLPGLGLRQTSFPNDSLCTDTRTCLETQVVPTSLLFQLNIWVSIMNILRNSGDIDRPVVELREITNLYIRSARECIHNCSSVFYDQEVIFQFKQQTEALVETIQAQARGLVPPDDYINTLQTFAYNPWAIGTTLQDVIMQLHYHAARLINKSGYLSSTIQLYNAFRADQLQKWPLMEDLLRIGGKIIFEGRANHVRKGKYTLGFLVSMCAIHPELLERNPTESVPYRHTGLSTGVFLEVDDESLLSRLVPRAPFHGHNDTVLHWKQQDPIAYLSFIRTQAEQEMSTTGMGMDLFRVEILAQHIIRDWFYKSWKGFLDAFGPEFIRPLTETHLLVGHFFRVLETPVESCRRAMHKSTPTRMRNNVVLVMKAARKLEEEKSTHRVVRNYLDPKFKY